MASMQQQPETEYHPQLDRFITEAEEAEYNRRHADLINEMRESIDCRMANTIHVR